MKCQWTVIGKSKAIHLPRRYQLISRLQRCEAWDLIWCHINQIWMGKACAHACQQYKKNKKQKTIRPHMKTNVCTEWAKKLQAQCQVSSKKTTAWVQYTHFLCYSFSSRCSSRKRNLRLFRRKQLKIKKQRNLNCNCQIFAFVKKESCTHTDFVVGSCD